MAILKSQFPVTGSMGDLSFYTVRGSDKIIVRRKGGPSRKKVLKSERFTLNRLNMSEFSGRVRASQLIMRGLLPLRRIFDYSVVNALHKPLKAIQDLDSVSPKGKRSIELSRKPGLLEGITLNKKNALDAVIRTSVTCSFKAGSAGVTIGIPELIPDVNFFTPGQYPFYRIIVALAVVPDLHCHESNFVSAVPGLPDTHLVYDMTRWLPTRSTSPALTLDLTAELPVTGPGLSYLVSVGIEFGTSSDGAGIQTVKHQGAGKVLRTGKTE